uniref:EDR1/CTR1/ARMC3-like peptidase-like domain-containing protein n=1 Tax=Mola mola TaxID=94237 RepID=A0A3Q3W2W6_MOLML
FEPLCVEGKSLQTVVLLLKSTEEDVLIKACEAIHLFAEKAENKVSLLGLGALSPLCRLITHENIMVKRNALMALGIMATNDVIIQEFATLCLASLSVDFICKVQIFIREGLPPLVQLLSSPDPDVTKNSLEVIYNQVQDYHSRQAVHELGGIPPLLQLLESDFPVIQHLALKTLQIITADKDTRDTFREEQGFEKLLDDFCDLHVEALQVVVNFLTDSESLHLIHQDGGLTRLMEFFLTPNISEVQCSAVECITRVAHSEIRRVLHEHNVEKVLVEFLSVEDDRVQTATCKAVHALSFYRASMDSFRDLGIPAVLELLNSESSMVREAATLALCSLTDGSQLNVAVSEARGHKVLIQQLYGSCPGTLANTAAVLCNMAEQVVIRSSILSHGAMQALVEPLKSTNPQVLVKTLRCLTVLACEADARAEALEMLQEINQSESRRSSFSSLAMTSLLNSNLSVKYSLTDNLTFTDIIRDGFYDAGKARAGQSILTLEELSKQPVNQHRPIIAVEEDDRLKEKSESETPDDKQWKMMDDASLQNIVQEVKKSILSLSDEREQYAALALVSDTMGGAVERDKLHEFPWVLHFSELKFRLQSNVVPIGLIRRGIYCHRALLFKCLADCIGLSCTLVRGEYNRAWNEVRLFTGNPSGKELSSQPSRYIVDLMHQPGCLLAVNTLAAVRYTTI